MEVGPGHYGLVSGLPRTSKGHNSIWVVLDRLTKSAHFILAKTTYSLDRLAELYVWEIVWLHWVPNSIVSDWDSRFQGSWDKYLPLVGLSYSNSNQLTVGMVPYEALGGQKYRLPVHWDEVGERKYLGPELVEQSTEVIKKI